MTLKRINITLVFITLLAGSFCARAQCIDTLNVPIMKAQVYRVPHDASRNYYLWMVDCGTIVSPNNLDSVVVLWCNKCGMHTITLVDTTGQSCKNDTLQAQVLIAGTPLPVELVSFTATLQDPQTARLDWQTASEINNKYFSIERSLDAMHFTLIGTVNGNGTTDDIHNYSLLDEHVDLLPGCNLFYRLKQFDYNGSSTDWGIRQLVVCTVPKIDATKVWYNQSDNRVYINLIRDESMSARLLVTDMRGKTISSENIQATQGTSQISLSLFGLAKGIYNVTVSDQTGTMTRRIVKQ